MNWAEAASQRRSVNWAASQRRSVNWAASQRHFITRAASQRRSIVGLACLLLAFPAVGHALTQVSGPVEIGPSAGDGDPQQHSATLSTTIVNQGGLPDRLVNVACPGTGTANLLNGQVQPVGDVQRNGLDLPGSVEGRATAVSAQIGLSNAGVPMTPGALIPCSLYFEHAGQRLVVFTLGVHDSASREP